MYIGYRLLGSCSRIWAIVSLPFTADQHWPRGLQTASGLGIPFAGSFVTPGSYSPLAQILHDLDLGVAYRYIDIYIYMYV